MFGPVFDVSSSEFVELLLVVVTTGWDSVALSVLVELAAAVSLEVCSEVDQFAAVKLKLGYMSVNLEVKSADY